MAVIDLFDESRDLLLAQLDRVAELPFYQERFNEAGVDVADVDSLEKFQELPLMDSQDLLADVSNQPPRGSFYSDEVRQVNLTPAGDELMPEYNTGYDLQRMAEAMGEIFEANDIGPGDIVLNCTGYELFIAGMAIHRGMQEAGAAVVPVGAGDSEQAARLAKQLDVDGIMAFPSFGLKIAEQADISLKTFVGGGEPFTSVPGLRERVREAFGGETIVADLFALSEILPVAGECKHSNGLHVVDDYVLVEVIDPETKEPVEVGERGEVVLTHLDKEAMPLVRYRTGDLTTVEERQCPCGRSNITLPNGVFGRVDSRLKVKGVKFYPDSIVPVLAEFPGLTGEFSVEVVEENQTDSLYITCESTDPEMIETAKLKNRLSAELLVSPDGVSLVEDLDVDQRVDDQRYSERSG